MSGFSDKDLEKLMDKLYVSNGSLAMAAMEAEATIRFLFSMAKKSITDEELEFTRKKFKSLFGKDID